MQLGNTIFRQEIAQVINENNLGRGQFVGMNIFPILNVNAREGGFAKISFSSVKTKAVEDRRGPNGEYGRTQQNVGRDTYECIKRGLETPVDDDDARILSSYFDSEVASAERLRYLLKINREARQAAIAFSTAVMSGLTTAATSVWSDTTAARPVDDVGRAKDAIIEQLNGNSDGTSKIIGVGNLSLKRELLNTDDIKNRHYSGGNINRKEPTNAQLADILDLDEIHFSKIKRNGSDIWNNTRFGIYQVSDSPLLSAVPMFGRTFLWTDSTPEDWMVESYREDQTESTIIRVKSHSADKSLVLRAGNLITGV